MKREKNEYCLGPFNVNDHCWYYTENNGVLVVAELYEKGRYVGTTKNTIPWNDVRNALAIKDHGRRVKRKAP